MRVWRFGIAAIAFCAAAPAWAEPAITLDLDLGVVSDYRSRGVSYSARDPAVQGEVSIAHEAGGYARLWATSIEETEGGAQLELNLEAGWQFPLADRLSLGVGATAYIYPGEPSANYLEPLLVLSYELGPATPTLGLAYVPGQGATRDAFGRKRDNLYIFAGLEVPVKGTPLTVNGLIGYERGAFDFSRGGGKWDWELGGAVTLNRLTLGLTYIDGTVEGEPEQPGATDATLVGSLLFGF